MMVVITFPDYCSLNKYNHLHKYLQMSSMQPPQDVVQINAIAYNKVLIR